MTTFRAAQFAYFQRRNKVNKYFFVAVLLSAFEERKLENNIVDTLKPPVVSDDWPVDVCSTSGALEHVYTLCIRTCTFLFFFCCCIVPKQENRSGSDAPFNTDAPVASTKRTTAANNNNNGDDECGQVN